MENILLAFDGSEYSNRALQYAKMFADRFEATLWLAHIFTHTSDLLGYEDYEKLYSKRKASGQKLLNEAFQELSNSICKVREKLEEGPEAESILNIAKKCQADLIVMGTRGHGTLTGIHFTTSPVVDVEQFDKLGGDVKGM